MSEQKIEIKVDNQFIRGILYKPEIEPKKLALLFIHGWRGKPNLRAAKLAAEKGYFVLAISLRGHNDSDGDIKEVTRSGSLQDVLKAYDFLRTQIPADTQIVPIGSSYGGYLTALLSSERPVAAISIRVPATYPDAGFDEPQYGKGHEDPEIMRWRTTEHAYLGNKSFEAVHNFNGPIQLIEAELDDAIPHESIENYKRAIIDQGKLDYNFMKGWPHSMGNDERRNLEFQKVLFSWLEKIESAV